jgi:hypothetical protein
VHCAIETGAPLRVRDPGQVGANAPAAVFRLRGRTSFEATFIEAVAGYSGRVACFEPKPGS